MPPAARTSDSTTHGTPLMPGPGSVNVLIGYMPAWRATIDQHVCPAVNITGADGVGSVIMGSPTVLINNMMACRMGDIVVEKPGLALGPANPIIMGCSTVMIGEAAGSVSPSAAGATAPSGFPPTAASRSANSGAGALSSNVASSGLASTTAGGVAVGGSPSSASDEQTQSSDKTSWYKAQVVSSDGEPARSLPYKLKLPDGKEVHGTTDDHGYVRVGGIPPGKCELTLTTVHKKLWGSQ